MGRFSRDIGKQFIWDIIYVFVRHKGSMRKARPNKDYKRKARTNLRTKTTGNVNLEACIRKSALNKVPQLQKSSYPGNE